MDADNLRAILNGLKGRWIEISEQTGIKYSTLVKFADGRTEAMQHSRMETLKACQSVRAAIKAGSK